MKRLVDYELREDDFSDADVDCLTVRVRRCSMVERFLAISRAVAGRQNLDLMPCVSKNRTRNFKTEC
jgi:hypothetical protein